MADDNNFNIGDILWEYADYVPPEEDAEDAAAPRPSAPAPVQPVLSAPQPVSSPVPSPRPSRQNTYLPANAPPAPPPESPSGEEGTGSPVPVSKPAAEPVGVSSVLSASPPAAEAAGGPASAPFEPGEAGTMPQTGPFVLEAASSGYQPPDDGPDLIGFTPDPKARPQASGDVPSKETGQEQKAKPSGEKREEEPGKPEEKKEQEAEKKQPGEKKEQEAGKKPPEEKKAQESEKKPPEEKKEQEAGKGKKPSTEKKEPAKEPPGKGKAEGGTAAAAAAQTPGVHLKTERKEKPAPEPPPDAPPVTLAQEYYQGLSSVVSKSIGAVIFSAVLLLLSLMESGLFPMLTDLFPETILHPVGLFVFVLTCLLCRDVLKSGLIHLTNRSPNEDSLALLATLFTLTDSLTLLLLHLRTDTLPFFAPCGFVLTFHLVGHACGRSARYHACTTVSSTVRPYMVTQDHNVIGSQTAFRKWLSHPKGFGSQIRTPTEPELKFQKLTPVLLTACILVPLITTVAHHQPRLAFWSLSALFATASTLGASMALELPFRLVTGRLKKLGAALAGWPGIARSKGGRTIQLGDYDLYPPGTITLADAKPLNGRPMEESVKWAASVIRASGSGQTYLFDQIRQRAKVAYEAVHQVSLSPSGISARSVSGGVRIHVGNSEFMSQHGIALPVNVKASRDTVFCAADMIPIGMFSLNYSLHPSILPCLQNLYAQKIYPLFATRDYNLTPQRLRASGQLPLLEDAFPDIGRRKNLSEPGQPHHYPLVAVLTREGLLSFSQTVIAAKRLRRTAGLNSFFVRAGAIIGVILTASLSSAGALGAMCAWNLSVYLLLWLVPVVLLSLWSTRF